MKLNEDLDGPDEVWKKLDVPLALLDPYSDYNVCIDPSSSLKFNNSCMKGIAAYMVFVVVFIAKLTSYFI